MKEKIDMYTIGVDFGTDSVRSLIVNTSNGKEVEPAKKPKKWIFKQNGSSSESTKKKGEKSSKT